MPRKRYLLYAAFLLTALLVYGCAAPFSEGLKKQVDETVSISRVMADPKTHQGALVMWGGIILSTLPREKTTVIEIIERPLDSQKRPKETDTTHGRFLASYNGFLDPAVYCQGREITVVGKISGSESAMIGDYNYTYPVVAMEERYLWPVPSEPVYPAYPAYPYYNPWWWYY